MLFALATDENALGVFASSADATAQCEGVDVEDGGWQFWDETGTALVAQFFSPNRRGTFLVENGDFVLMPAPDQPSLALVLPSIHHLEPNPSFPNLASVASYLWHCAGGRTEGT